MGEDMRQLRTGEQAFAALALFAAGAVDEEDAEPIGPGRGGERGGDGPEQLRATAARGPLDQQVRALVGEIDAEGAPGAGPEDEDGPAGVDGGGGGPAGTGRRGGGVAPLPGIDACLGAGAGAGPRTAPRSGTLGAQVGRALGVAGVRARVRRTAGVAGVERGVRRTA